MKKSTHFFAITIAATLFLFSCGSKSEPAKDATTTDATATAAAEAAAPAATVFAAGVMPAQGSKIYIAPAGKANKVGAHLSNAINTGGYWTIVGSEAEADFIMQPVLQEKGMAVNGHVVLKNLDGSTIMQSPNFKAISFAGNGFSAWRGFGTQVGKWLKGK